MKKEIEFWQFVAAKLEKEQWVGLLVVVESSGSSPGRPGFKMAVAADSMFGSIGGGQMEVSLVDRVRANALSLRSDVIEQVHNDSSPDSSGMICSGNRRSFTTG